MSRIQCLSIYVYSESSTKANQLPFANIFSLTIKLLLGFQLEHGVEPALKRTKRQLECRIQELALKRTIFSYLNLTFPLTFKLLVGIQSALNVKCSLAIKLLAGIQLDFYILS